MNKGPCEIEASRALKDTFSYVHGVLPEQRVTLSMILTLFGKESFFFLAAFLTLPFLAPASIPGLSTAFGAVILLMGMSLVLYLPPWLPARFMPHVVPSDKLRTCLSHDLIWIRLSNTLPALAILLLSIGIFPHDGIFIIFGYFSLALTSIYFGFIVLLDAQAINMAVSKASGWL